MTLLFTRSALYSVKTTPSTADHKYCPETDYILLSRLTIVVQKQQRQTDRSACTREAHLASFVKRLKDLLYYYLRTTKVLVFVQMIMEVS